MQSYYTEINSLININFITQISNEEKKVRIKNNNFNRS